MKSNEVYTEQERKNVVNKINYFEKTSVDKRFCEYEMRMLLLFGEMVKEIHEISPGDRKC